MKILERRMSQSHWRELKISLESHFNSRLSGFILVFSVFTTPLLACDVSPKNYEYTMSTIGRVNDSELLVLLGEIRGISVKMNGECRGYATFEDLEEDGQLFFLTAYSNVPQGEQLSFHLYGSLDSIEIEKKLPFIDNQILGSISEPFLLSGEAIVLGEEGSVVEDAASFEEIVHISRNLNGQFYLQNLLQESVYYEILSISGHKSKSGELSYGGRAIFPKNDFYFYVVRISPVSGRSKRASHYSKKIFFKL